MLGGVSFVVPGIAGLGFWSRLAIFSGAIVTIPAWTALHFGFRYSRYLFRLGHYFPKFMEGWRGQTREADARQRETDMAYDQILREGGFARSIDIIHCFAYNNTVHIKIQRRRSLSLREGSELHVHDRELQAFLGRFVVVKVESSGYTAKRVGELDPGWAGYVLTSGAVPTEAPPGAIVIALREKESDDG